MTEAERGMIDAEVLYNNLIKQLGMEATDNQGNRLRQHPRFGFDTPERKMLIQRDGFNCSLNDVSVGGISFLAAHNFNIGRRLNLDFEENFGVGVNVVRVVAQDRDEESTHRLYLHGCQFLRGGMAIVAQCWC